MRRLLVTLFAWAMICGLAAPMLAQTGDPIQEQAQPKIDKRKLIIPPRNDDGSLITTPFWENPIEWAKDQQRVFSEAITAAMNGIKSGSSPAAATTLMLLSFGYGVFHAAGPGHGKAVISTWLLATGNELRRGIAIAFMSAFVQAISAIVIVTGVLLIATNVKATTFDVANVTESTSFALIGLMGFWLIWSALRPHQLHSPAHAHHSHDHHSDDHHSHDHHANAHAHDGNCGHSHFPRQARSRANGRGARHPRFLSRSGSGLAPAPYWR